MMELALVVLFAVFMVASLSAVTIVFLNMIRATSRVDDAWKAIYIRQEVENDSLRNRLMAKSWEEYVGLQHQAPNASERVSVVERNLKPYDEAEMRAQAEAELSLKDQLEAMLSESDLEGGEPWKPVHG